MLILLLGNLSVLRLEDTSRRALGLEQTHLARMTLLLQLRVALTRLDNEARDRMASDARREIRPPFDLIPADILVRFKYVFPVVGVAIFLLEIGYVFLIWRRGIGRVWLIAVLIMHLGIGLTMGMYLFASIMIILNLAAFGPGKLWREKELSEDVDLSLSVDPA